MRDLFKQKVSFFKKWVGLFTGAIVLAVILAHSLDSSELLVPPVVESPSTQAEPLVSADSDEQDIAVHERYGRRWVHYATVSRSDRSFRQMFIAASDVNRVEAGQPLPDNTLILMETWYSSESPGTVFIKQKLNGVWQYGSFSPTRPDYHVSERGSCHSCHSPFPETDFTLTKPLLEATLQTQQLQTAYCDRAGRIPCVPDAYFPDVRSSS